MEKGLQIGGLTESGFRKHVALRVPSLCSASDCPSHLLLSNSPEGCAFARDSKAVGLWPREHQAWLKVLILKTADSVKLILNIDTLSSQPQRSSWTLKMPVPGVYASGKTLKEASLTNLNLRILKFRVPQELAQPEPVTVTLTVNNPY